MLGLITGLTIPPGNGNAARVMGSALPHVADLNARMSLTGIASDGTYRVVQDDTGETWQYNGPGSTDQGGVFVLGGSQDGVFADSGTYSGRPIYFLLGLPGDPGSPGDSGAPVYWDGNQWNIRSDSGLIYYSPFDVATPDLVPPGGWFNASDDSPASITVTSVTYRDLNAGVTVAGAGQSNDTNSTFYVSPDYPPQFGRQFYVDAAHGGAYDPIGWNGVWYLGDGSYTGGADKAFPWQATDYSGSPSPLPTVTRSDIAAPENWERIV